VIVRQALFEGSIHAGREAEFRAFVEERLIPMWRRFPGARDVRVMFARERDDGAPPNPFTLAMTFATRRPSRPRSRRRCASRAVPSPPS
jgi:hypothetical protein